MALRPLPDFGLLSGEAVTVLTPSSSLDEHMEESVTWAREEVRNVIVEPSSTAAVADRSRPHGTRAAFSLCFPKAFGKPLRGCRVVVRCPDGEDEAAHTYAVIGDPHPLTGANCPGAWWYEAEVEAVDG